MTSTEQLVASESSEKRDVGPYWHRAHSPEAVGDNVFDGVLANDHRGRSECERGEVLDDEGIEVRSRSASGGWAPIIPTWACRS